MIYCDWCDRAIYGEKQTGYLIEAVPFQPLNIAGERESAKKPAIVSHIHLHERLCQEAFFSAATELVDEHEPTEHELDYDHTKAATAQDEDELPTREVRHRKWEKLPKREQDRMVLEVLGAGRLSNREVHERLDKVGDGDGPCPYLPSNEVSLVTRRMFKAGELEREVGQWGRSRCRYFRRKLSPELKRLEESLAANVQAEEN